MIVKDLFSILTQKIIAVEMWLLFSLIEFLDEMVDGVVLRKVQVPTGLVRLLILEHPIHQILYIITIVVSTRMIPTVAFPPLGILLQSLLIVIVTPQAILIGTILAVALPTLLQGLDHIGSLRRDHQGLV